MTPGAGTSVVTSKLSVKKPANTNDFLDASVQAFKDIAATMQEKHSTDKKCFAYSPWMVSLPMRRRTFKMPCCKSFELPE
jgi:hypothetical protein